MRSVGRAPTWNAGLSWASATRIGLRLRLQCRVYAALSDLPHEGFATAAVPLGAACRRLRFGQAQGLRTAWPGGGAERIRRVAGPARIGRPAGGGRPGGDRGRPVA